MRKSKEQWWIERKLKSGVSREQLLHTVGAFSNKKKERVMKEKNLTEKQYRDRYEFLSNVYVLLSSTPAPRPQPAPRSRENWIFAKPRRIDPPRKKDTMDRLYDEFQNAGAALNGIGRDPKGYLRDRMPPPLDYSQYFDFDRKGRIKGGYTPDGFFEPD